jgi:protein phosphatase
MQWRQSVAYASLSDVGFRRANNQDSYAYTVCTEESVWRSRGHLFLVADGMGGHAVGELASKLAADTVPHEYYRDSEHNPADALVESLVEANRVINDRGTHNRDFDRMGTTCTAITLGPEGLHIGHVGDSRAYRVRNGLIEQLTFDHSLQWELIRQGTVKPEEVHLHHPRNVITRCLGPEAKVNVDLEGPISVLPGDRFILCSDGLTGHMQDEEIGYIVGTMAPKYAAKLLVHLTNLRGGSDNTTVVIVHIGDAPADQSASRLPAMKAVPSESSPALLGGLWAVLAGLTGGASLWIVGQKTAGQALMVIGLMGLVGWLAFAWKHRKKTGPIKVADAGKGAKTQGPYRRAQAKVTRAFMTHLAAVVGELQRTSEEENWEVNGPRMQALADEAANAVDRKKPGHAMRLYTDAIDHFMKAILEHRKKQNTAT